MYEPIVKHSTKKEWDVDHGEMAPRVFENSDGRWDISRTNTLLWFNRPYFESRFKYLSSGVKRSESIPIRFTFSTTYSSNDLLDPRPCYPRYCYWSGSRDVLRYSQLAQRLVRNRLRRTRLSPSLNLWSFADDAGTARPSSWP